MSSRLLRNRPESEVRNLVFSSLSFLLMFSLALDRRSLLGIAGILGASLLTHSHNPVRVFRTILNGLVTPYLPFVLLTILLVPFQEKVTESFWLLSISLSYVLARVLRVFVGVQYLAIGVLITGLLMETLRLLSFSSIGAAIPTLGKLIEGHHKNGVAWAAAFAVGMAAFFLSHLAQSWILRTALVLLFLGAGIVTLLSDSVTAIIASFAGATVVGGLVLLRGLRDHRFRKLRTSVFVVGAAAAVLAGLLILANTFREKAEFLSPLQRETNLTGRTDIWECYVGAVVAGSSKDEVLACRLGNLHSSFLEAHLNGGLITSVALVFGFLAAIGLSVRKALQSRGVTSFYDALFAGGLAIIGLVIALVESYVFSGYFYMSILVFMGPSVSSIRKISLAGLKDRFARRAQA